MGGHVATDPNFVPRTGVLLARTCIACGRFLGAQHFWVNDKAGTKRRQACNNCEHKRKDPKWWEQQSAAAKAFYVYAQDLTKALAVNHSRRWSAEDLEILADKSLSNLECALKLGRTYATICTQRRRFGISARAVEEWKIIRAISA